MCLSTPAVQHTEEDFCGRVVVSPLIVVVGRLLGEEVGGGLVQQGFVEGGGRVRAGRVESLVGHVADDPAQTEQQTNHIQLCHLVPPPLHS